MAWRDRERADADGGRVIKQTGRDCDLRAHVTSTGLYLAQHGQDPRGSISAELGAKAGHGRCCIAGFVASHTGLGCCAREQDDQEHAPMTKALLPPQYHQRSVRSRLYVYLSKQTECDAECAGRGRMAVRAVKILGPSERSLFRRETGHWSSLHFHLQCPPRARVIRLALEELIASPPHLTQACLIQLQAVRNQLRLADTTCIQLLPHTSSDEHFSSPDDYYTNTTERPRHDQATGRCLRPGSADPHSVCAAKVSPLRPR